MINRLGRKVGIKLNPHDLRRHSATFASRNGMPPTDHLKGPAQIPELKTTKVYLGKVSDTEAMGSKW
jgi:integrase/recombinase XerD